MSQSKYIETCDVVIGKSLLSIYNTIDGIDWIYIRHLLKLDFGEVQSSLVNYNRIFMSKGFG